MKFIKIDNREYALRYNTKTIREMNKKNITFKTLTQEIQDEFNTEKLYDAFYYGLKDLNDITKEDVDNILDRYFEDNTFEDLIELVLGEMANALGFYSMFKREMEKMKKAQQN